MDIPSLSMGLAQNNVLNSVGTAILSQSLDQAASIGNAVTEMILRQWSVLYALRLAVTLTLAFNFLQMLTALTDWLL